MSENLIKEGRLLPSFYFLIFIALLSVLMFSQWKVSVFLSNKNTTNKVLFAPPTSIKYFTFGYDLLMADSSWLRVIQDIDQCGEVSKRVRPKGDIYAPKCEKGWAYQMMNVATTLDNKFNLVYRLGATYLSVVVGDQKGASVIFDRGIETYPEDWKIYYRAGYHFMLEDRQLKKAGDYLRLAAKYGAPSWASALSASIYTKAGRAEYARKFLKELLEDDPDNTARPRIEQRLAEIESQLSSGSP